MNRDAAKLRLDQLLVERGLFATRSRARDAVLRGSVRVGGTVMRKPGQPVAASVVVQLDDPAVTYVSRAALKLIHGLDHFAIDVERACAVDIGASTGGFTQVLLERGADRIFAVDVGHGQMDHRLATNPRVTLLERSNARDLTTGHLGGAAPDIVVCDASFISLRPAAGPALDLAAAGARCVLLVKPQFEAGPEAIGKGGLLRDAGQGARIAEELAGWLETRPGWHALGIEPSPVTGAQGNREFLLAGIRDGL